MCTEGLTSLLIHEVETYHTKGIPICRNGPWINHLFFADDIIIFCKADVEENKRVQNLLDTYDKASGQKFNKAKTSLLFGKNVGPMEREQIMDLWDVHGIQQPGKYLGMLLVVGKNQNRVFSDIQYKVWQKLHG